jgi:hypothetical protein
MDILDLVSDQLDTWSDHAKHTVVDFAQASCPVAAANAGSGYAAAWLAHRTLQALRQAWLQVCRRSRPWPQVLPVGELSRAPAADGLRATGRSRRHSRTLGELPPGPRDHRGDLRDQSRTVTPPRGALRDVGEPAATAAHPLLHRSAIGRRTHRQHARVLAERRLRAGSDQGGRR